MDDLLKIILYAGAAGFPIILGGLLSYLFRSSKSRCKNIILHWLIAFGGGALLSAIAFVLIPQAVLELSILSITFLFLLGSFTFMFLEQLLHKFKGSFSQAMSMMMDFIPEAIALGASFAHNHNLGLLLAIFIGLQNFPEGFNSYNEFRKKLSNKLTLLLLLGLSFTGIIGAVLGDVYLVDKAKVISALMLFSAGGIIYMIFQDIAPMAKTRNTWIPATGASVGFLIGMIGDKILLL